MSAALFLAEYAASEPVSPGRGTAVLGLVIVVALLMLILPTRNK